MPAVRSRFFYDEHGNAGIYWNTDGTLDAGLCVNQTIAFLTIEGKAVLLEYLDQDLVETGLIAGISSEVHRDPIDAHEFRRFPFRTNALIAGFFEDLI